MCIFEKVSDGTETTVTAAWDTGTGEIEAIVLKIGNADSPAVVVPANQSQSGGSVWSSPTITTPVDECLLFVGGVSTGTSSWTAGNEPDNTTLVKQQAGTSMWLGLAFMQFATAGSTAGNGNNQWANTVNSKNAFAFAIAPSAAAAPTISSGTPTGTTTATPTLGFTTDTTSGTARFVVDSAANLSGVTASQVLNGQKASGAAAAYLSNTITVSSTSVSGSLTASLPAGTYTVAAAQNDGTDNSNVLTWAFTVAAPDITSISDDTPYPGQSITLTVTGAEASQGTGSVKINGVTQTITSWSDTSLTFTAVLGTNKYGTSYNIVVQNNSGNSSSGDTVTMVPPAGYDYVNVGTPNTTAANRLTASPDIASGDQVEYEDDGFVTVAADGTFEIAAGATYPYAFDFRVWTPGDGWGSSATQPVNDPDIVTPFVDSATVGTNGTTVTVVFSEAVEAGAGGSGGMVVTPLSLSGIALTYASGDGTDTWTFTAASTIYKNRPVELAYTQPGDGIQDLVGNELGSFSEFVVTNNSAQNQAPTDIALSKSTVSVTAGLNATVGTLSATDADYGETFTFTLVAGTGDTNNADFSISGTTLRCDDPATLGVGTYSVRVQVADGSGGTYAKAFSIEVQDAPNSFGLGGGLLQFGSGIGFRWL